MSSPLSFLDPTWNSTFTPLDCNWWACLCILFLNGTDLQGFQPKRAHQSFDWYFGLLMQLFLITHKGRIVLWSQWNSYPIMICKILFLTRRLSWEVNINMFSFYILCTMFVWFLGHIWKLSFSCVVSDPLSRRFPNTGGIFSPRLSGHLMCHSLDPLLMLLLGFHYFFLSNSSFLAWPHFCLNLLISFGAYYHHVSLLSVCLIHISVIESHSFMSSSI